MKWIIMNSVVSDLILEFFKGMTEFKLKISDISWINRIGVIVVTHSWSVVSCYKITEGNRLFSLSPLMLPSVSVRGDIGFTIAY